MSSLETCSFGFWLEFESKSEGFGLFRRTVKQMAGLLMMAAFLVFASASSAQTRTLHYHGPDGTDDWSAPSILGTVWENSSSANINGNTSTKITPPDINTTADGFIHSVEGQPSYSMGSDMTFIDFVSSQSHLQTESPDILTRDLGLQLTSINNETEDYAINADIARGFSTTPQAIASRQDISLLQVMEIPEPSTVALLGLSLLSLPFWLKQWNRRGS